MCMLVCISTMLITCLSYPAANFSYFDERIDVLTKKCVSELEMQGFKQ